MKYHEIPLNWVVYHGFSWFITVYHNSIIIFPLKWAAAKRSCLSGGAKAMLARSLVCSLRTHSFSLRAGIAYADAYAGLCTPGFCSRRVLIATCHSLTKNELLGIWRGSHLEILSNLKTPTWHKYALLSEAANKVVPFDCVLWCFKSSWSSSCRDIMENIFELTNILSSQRPNSTIWMYLDGQPMRWFHRSPMVPNGPQWSPTVQ